MTEKRPWGMRDWSLAITLVLGAISLLTTLLSFMGRGAEKANGWVDGRARVVADETARKVVHDSLSAHRYDRRPHRRR